MGKVLVLAPPHPTRDPTPSDWSHPKDRPQAHLPSEKDSTFYFCPLLKPLRPSRIVEDFGTQTPRTSKHAQVVLGPVFTAFLLLLGP